MLAIVCALRCEAECLIEHFKLKSLPQKSLFPIYGDGELFLTISGLGKLQAAAAVSYLYAMAGERSFAGWINVGIGGHPSHEIGQGFLAHQVIDQGSLRAFYPTFTWQLKGKTETIYTVDTVEKNFTQSGIYDMEASGFCSSAFGLASAECIHCYKVISDNLETPPAKDPLFVKELILSNIARIEELIHNLKETVSDVNVYS